MRFSWKTNKVIPSSQFLNLNDCIPLKMLLFQSFVLSLDAVVGMQHDSHHFIFKCDTPYRCRCWYAAWHASFHLQMRHSISEKLIYILIYLYRFASSYISFYRYNVVQISVDSCWCQLFTNYVLSITKVTFTMCNFVKWHAFTFVFANRTRGLNDTCLV